MKPAAIATHDRKTDPPPSTIGLAENVENPATPTTPGTAAALAEELKQELKVANETVNAKLVEPVQVEEDEKRLLSAEVNRLSVEVNRLSAEVNRLRADREKLKEFVVSVQKELGELHKFVVDGSKEFLSGGIELDTRQG